MKKLSKVLALVVALVFLMGAFAACQKAENPSASATNKPDDTQNPAEKVAYTYHDYMAASPLTWNPHTWETNADDSLTPYITTQLIDTSIADDGVNYKWVYEGATAVTDVTKDFADKEKYGVPADATEKYVYQIDLEPTLTWSDGTAINADSYIYSMKQLLDSSMKNYRANTYYNGDTAIANALGYYNNDKAGQPIYQSACDADGKLIEGLDDTKLFFNVDEVVAFFGDGSCTDYYADYKANFADANGADLYEKYKGQGYVAMSDALKADLLTMCNNFGDKDPANYVQFCVYANGTYEETAWESVGLLKTGEYQLTWVNQNAVSMFYMLSGLTGSGWLVKEDVYEAGKSTIEGLVATNYNTTLESTATYGPYKMVSFEKDKQIVLTKDENWFGYKDGKHEGQYQTTDVKVDIIGEHNTALQLFNQGALDNIELTSEDMPTYRMSDYIQKTDQTYTFRFIFATDIAKLTALEAEANDGANKKVLSYDDFRKALSLAIDRAKLCAEGTSAYKPAYYLLNSLYYYDIENNPDSIYRNSTPAKEAVLNLYGIKYGDGEKYATVDEAYASVTGFDVEEAKALFQSVYEKAIADGNYTEGQAVNINCMASAAETLTADDTKQQDLLNAFVAEATKGTGFEGKITFKFNCGAKKRYEDVALGKVEMIRGAWGGAAFYPFSTIRVYCEPDYMNGITAIHESCGWDPTKETLKMTYDFNGDGTAEEVEATFQSWAKSINVAAAGDPDAMAGKYADDHTISMAILSNLETGILSSYQCIPWATETQCTMFSKKVNWATLDYNIMYAYGGIRLLTYNYNDAEWDAYVADQGGTLSYE